MIGETTDAELVKMALADNKEAFRLLIERYQVMDGSVQLARYMRLMPPPSQKEEAWGNH